MAALAVGIQPDVMKWARESIGLSVPDVAAILKRSEAEIHSWEAGDAFPTYAQLEKLAYKIYKRPLAVFFLPQRPIEKDPEKEFRSLPDADLEQLIPNTRIRIRKAHAYQLSLRELFENQNPAERHIWDDINLSSQNSIQDAAQLIRNYLEVDMTIQSSWNNSEFALKEWRSLIEKVGVFIFKDSFEQKEISGFCLLDPNFPIIYLNNSAAKTRQIFSLFHELAHILADVNGLSKFDKSYFKLLPKKRQNIEVFCNAIAAQILIPSSDFQEQTKNWPQDIESQDDEEFSNISTRYGVSREAILRIFLDQKRVSQRFYKMKANYWASQKKSVSGGNWYLSQNAYLSSRFASEVVRRHYNQKLTVEQASEILGIKAKNFSGLETLILKGSDN